MIFHPKKAHIRKNWVLLTSRPSLLPLSTQPIENYRRNDCYVIFPKLFKYN